MITEDYVSYETAKLLKEKGFREWCSHCYGVDVRYKGNPIDEDEEFELKSEGKEDEIEYVDGGRLYNSMWDNSDESKIYAAPTLAIAIKWIRNTYKIHIEARICNHALSDKVNIIKYYWVLINAEICRWMDESTAHDLIAFNTPEEAYENAIKYCLEKINLK